MNRKQVAVIGLGRLGVSVATTLQHLGHEVLAIELDEKKVQSMASQITHAVQADATSEAVLRELGIGNFDIAIVTTSAIANSVLSTILLKKLGVRHVIARADSELHADILDRIGADKVVYPENEMGIMIAHVLTLGDVIDYIPVVSGYGILKLTPPSYFVGETLSGLGFGAKGEWQVAVLLIQRQKEVLLNPNYQEMVKPGDSLVVAGNVDKLEELIAKARKTKTEK
jgi:trk system potassium uptake protein TrkA